MGEVHSGLHPLYHFRLKYKKILGVINFGNSEISQNARIRLNILANEQ